MFYVIYSNFIHTFQSIKFSFPFLVVMKLVFISFSSTTLKFPKGKRFLFLIHCAMLALFIKWIIFTWHKKIYESLWFTLTQSRYFFLLPFSFVICFWTVHPLVREISWDIFTKWIFPVSNIHTQKERHIQIETHF